MIVKLLLVVEVLMQVRRTPNEDGESMHDGEAESDDDSNDRTTDDSVDGLHRLRGPKGDHEPKGPRDPIGSVASLIMNLHVKCPIFSARDDEDPETHLLCSNDWMNSQGIAENAKCGRYCLTLSGERWLRVQVYVGQRKNRQTVSRSKLISMHVNENTLL